MLQIVLLIIGIVYALRKPKIRALTAEKFPDVPVDTFAQWQALEIKSINLFLWATWGTFIPSIALGIVMATAGCQVQAFGFDFWLFLMAFIVLLGISAIPGTKAARLKKEFRISWESLPHQPHANVAAPPRPQPAASDERIEQPCIPCPLCGQQLLISTLNCGPNHCVHCLQKFFVE